MDGIENQAFCLLPGLFEGRAGLNTGESLDKVSQSVIRHYRLVAEAVNISQIEVSSQNSGQRPIELSGC